MSLLDLPNPLEQVEVQAYYQDIYRFKINNSFDELQFSKGKINYGRLCKRLASIDLPDPSLLPYQQISFEELITNVKEILNKLFDNTYESEVDRLTKAIKLRRTNNPFDAALEEIYYQNQQTGERIHISDKISTIGIVALAHEIIHALLSKYNGEEYNKHLNNIHYKELLSVIVEYIVCYEISKTLQDDLSTKQRINRFFVANNNVIEQERMKDIIKLVPPILLPQYQIYDEYVNHNTFGNIITDAYGRRLLDLYKDDPSTLLKLVREIIDGDKQVRDLIKYYHLSLTDKPTIYGYYDSLEEVTVLSKKYQKI